MLIVPELILKAHLDAVLELLKSDYNTLTDKSKSFLYYMFYGKTLDKFNWYTEAITLFLRTGKDHRKIETRFMYDSERAHLPTIHITLPGETKGSDGIGLDENETDYDDTNFKYRPIIQRRYDANFNLIITSDNTLEVLLIYHAIRAMLNSIITSLDAFGLENIKVSGQDLNIVPGIIPEGIFARSIGVSLEYPVLIPRFFTDDMVQRLIITGKMILNDDEDESSSTI